MYFLNQYEIEDVADRYRNHPVLSKATAFLHSFMHEVNQHSDGWAYWRPPVQAAKQLMTLIHDTPRVDPAGVTEEAFKKALAPIRAFYTRRGNAAGMAFPSLDNIHSRRQYVGWRRGHTKADDAP
jgi:hypothetical protein